MADLLDLLNDQLGGAGVAELSRKLGTDQATTARAVPAAMTALLGALAGNAAKPQGAQALASALERDHDGSILSDVSGFLGSGNTGIGESILKHVLGGRQGAVTSRVSQATGLDSAAVAKLLALLAPVVLGALGTTKRKQGLDAGGLSDLLGGQRETLRQRAPEGLGGLLGGLLDADRDGDVMDDIAGHLGSLLGGGRR